MINPIRVRPSNHASDSRGAHSSHIRADQGMATLETALMIPVLLAITFAFLSLLNVGMQTLALSDATRTVARELARGAEVESVVTIFKEREPHASINLEWGDSTVSVVTSRPAELFVNTFGFHAFTLRQTHTAPREWN